MYAHKLAINIGKIVYMVTTEPRTVPSFKDFVMFVTNIQSQAEQLHGFIDLCSNSHLIHQGVLTCGKRKFT